MDWHAELSIFGEVAIAMLLGAMIGFEREMADKPAGLRTHMLVAASAALLVGLSDALLARYAAITSDQFLRSDPIRIVEAIVTGISFICAGTIFRRGNDAVEGLTTASTILLCSIIGISVALRLHILAVAVTIVTLLVLHAIRPLEDWLARRRHASRDTDA